jgi:hypothetical protein
MARAVRRGNWKLICPGGTPKLEKAFLFDLHTDPLETENRLETNPREGKDLKTELDTWKTIHPLFKAMRTDITLTEEETRKLQSLGYLK